MLELWHRQFVDQAGDGDGMKVVEIRQEAELQALRAAWNGVAGVCRLEYRSF